MLRTERHVDDVHTYDPGASTCAQDTGQNVHGGPVRTGIKEERKKKKKKLESTAGDCP